MSAHTLLSVQCVQTSAGILPYLAYLTDHIIGSALLHQIMDPDSGGGPPSVYRPIIPPCAWDLYECVRSGTQSAQPYYV